MNIYNERIKQIMREQKKTQRDLADLLGYAQPTIHQRLNSDKTFEIEDLLKVCRYFGVPISDFLYEAEGQGEIKKAEGPLLSPEDILAISTRRHDELLKRLSGLYTAVDELKSLVAKSLESRN